MSVENQGDAEMGMIITRRPGESVDIGDARVTVVRLRNGRVKLSVEAPPHVPIAPGGSRSRGGVNSIAETSQNDGRSSEGTRGLRVQD